MDFTAPQRKFLQESDLSNRELERMAAHGDEEALQQLQLRVARGSYEGEYGKLSPHRELSGQEVGSQTGRLGDIRSLDSPATCARKQGYEPVRPVLWFLQIEPADYDGPAEMQEISAGEAVYHAANYPAMCEVYFGLDPDDMPLVGFVFNNGSYHGFGLGDSCTKEFEDLSVQQQRDRPVSENSHWWHQFFARLMSP